MRKLRIGVWLLENSVPALGGVYGYYSELVNCISNTKFSDVNICFLGDHHIEVDNIGYYKYYAIKGRERRNRKILRFINLFSSTIFSFRAIKSFYQNLEKKQNESLHKICDIIYYPIQMCQYENFPFIYTLMDLGHLNSYAFPEVCNDGIFEERKDHFDRIPFKALMVFCESESGKMDAIHYLRLKDERLRVLPLFPSGVISEGLVCEKPYMMDLDWFFIHYPAQFWAHKNHYNLICAFRMIADKYPNLKLILTGSDHGNKTYITKTIREFNLVDRIIDLGFVALGELKWLYLHSKGLIMPTLLGPTNMPPLEALALGCPVTVSDLPGHREQLGNFATYFDPLNVEDIKNAIENLINNDIKQKASIFPTIKKNMLLLDKYFSEIKTIRQTWD